MAQAAQLLLVTKEATADLRPLVILVITMAVAAQAVAVADGGQPMPQVAAQAAEAAQTVDGARAAEEEGKGEQVISPEPQLSLLVYRVQLILPEPAVMVNSFSHT